MPKKDTSPLAVAARELLRCTSEDVNLKALEAAQAAVKAALGDDED